MYQRWNLCWRLRFSRVIQKQTCFSFHVRMLVSTGIFMASRMKVVLILFWFL